MSLQGGCLGAVGDGLWKTSAWIESGSVWKMSKSDFGLGSKFCGREMVKGVLGYYTK